MSEDDSRVLLAGFLSKDSLFELVVSGKIGAREISYLIRKLEVDLKILAEHEAAEAADETTQG